MTVDTILSVFLGIGHSASVGFRVFLPLFALSLAAYFNVWELNESWLLDKVLRESNLKYLKYLKASTICKLLKTKGYNIEEVLNWFQLLESGKEENYLLCLTIINSKMKL